MIFLFHTISPELSFVSINNPFPEFEFIFWWSVVLTMFCELLWQQISVNQRSVDNAHLEIVELCPASHRPLLTKVVHVWLDWAPSLKAWVRRSSSPLYNGQPLYSIRPKSSQDFMNGTITGQSSNGQSPHAWTLRGRACLRSSLWRCAVTDGRHISQSCIVATMRELRRN